MTELRKLCIIPCGSAKVWDKNPNAGPQKAKDIYTGIFAVACQRYAASFYDHWVILSAKHGFLCPNDVIPESYNVSFIKPSDETISNEELRNQARKKELLNFNEITVLGGKHYVDRAMKVFDQGQSFNLPLSDCKGIGYMLQKLTNALEANTSITSFEKQGDTDTVDDSDKTIGKYSPLYHSLRMKDEDSIELSIEQIESILGFKLPASAFKHRAWWSNDITHSQAKAWLYADWEVDQVSLTSITFRKIDNKGEMNLIITNQSGHHIYNLDDWLAYSPPAKGELQWKDGRSAKELAKAWLCTGEPKMPKELQQLLDSHHDTNGFFAERAIPEFVTKLDDFKGNGRNHDMIIWGNVAGQKALVSIEAKVDESFGEIISNYVSSSIAANPRSKVPDRISQLTSAIFGHLEIGHIRYQLLHAVAGVLIEAAAQKASLAVLVVHEFVPATGKTQKAIENDIDWQSFTRLIASGSILAGQLHGPITVPGGGKVPNDIPLYIGKIESLINI